MSGLSGPPILIVGLSAGGAAGLPKTLLQRILQADLLVGGRRHLDYFPDFDGQRFPIGANIQAVAGRLHQAHTTGERAVVLASGDPLWFGIGATLRRYFPPEALEIIPAATAFQLAFAVLAEPWHDAALLSAHARPAAEAATQAALAPKAAILTDQQHTPAVLAVALLEAGFSPLAHCAVCENLGSPEQRVVKTKLGKVGQQSYAPLNVFVVWNDKTEPGASQAQPAARSVSPGLPDDAFSTSAGQITKREIRLLTLAELALQPGEVLWDIGAGSGSVGIEAARAVPEAHVFAIEKRAALVQYAQTNLSRFPAPNLRLSQGIAPEDTVAWPAPHAVFIGGSGGRLEAIIAAVQQRLHPQGRLVLNLATLENLAKIRQLLPEAQINQLQISRGAPIMDMLRFEALNPVFMVVWRKVE